MDLSHLVSIGLVAGRRAPLSESEVEYFQKHGIEKLLTDIVNDLAKNKPADPYKAIIDKVVPHSKGAAVAASATPVAKNDAKPVTKPEVTPDKQAAKKPEAKAKAKAEGKKGGKKAELAVAVKQPSKGGGMEIKKKDDVPGWYAEVLMKSKMVEQYPVKGCFILRPWSYKIWEQIQGWFDKEIKGLGVENCYFPMFIPKCYLDKEKDHLEDFAPELAMVTKFGNSDLEEPVAIRPTSETAMYAAYGDWVQSHRDLPLKLNQWCSVVRWEVRQTTPFLRTREFLWQEGHTAFANAEDAKQEVLDILERYAGIYEKLLAIPVIRGTKTKAETFPGAEHTCTVEGYVPATGRGIQGGTSHYLGQNFSKMFDISFQDPKDPTGKTKEWAHQNSWGLSTRVIGVLAMVHGDDHGLILPPMVAGFQVVIVPAGLTKNTPEEARLKVKQTATEYSEQLSQAGLRVKLDDNDDNTFGYKCNEWELMGVPIRLEIGPQDIEKGSFVMAKRNVPGKAGKVFGKAASMVEDVKSTLDAVQSEMYETALKERDANLEFVEKWEDLTPQLEKNKLVLIPFCGDKACEEKVKEKTKEEAAVDEIAGDLKMGAKSLCVPHEEKYKGKPCTSCIMPGCANKNVQRTLFGRSY